MNVEKTFWEHLEDLRWSIIRMVVALLLLTILIFLFKDFVFTKIILAPATGDFVTYKELCRLGNLLNINRLCFDTFALDIINYNIAGQLTAHLSMSFYLAVVLTFPYMVAELWLFVLPALYKHEKRIILKMFVSLVLLFYTGILISYFVIFPFTIGFLSGYNVNEGVENMISLSSYLSTFNSVIFLTGLAFELPVAVYILGKFGILDSGVMKKHRKAAFVICMTLAALITPTTDVFTMMLVTLPLILLYEISIVVLKNVNN